MKFLRTCLLLCFCTNLSSSFAQTDKSSPADTYIANYYALLNNLGDAQFSVQEKKLFAVELLNNFFIPEQSMVFNDLNSDGSTFLKANEYLNQIIGGHAKGIEYDYELIDIGELDISQSPMIMKCVIDQVAKPKNKSDIRLELDFVIEIYNLSNDGSLYGRIKSINVNEEFKSRNLDTDNDGIKDADDKCPTEFGTIKHGGCPIPDTDNDGINDDEDQCPNVSGTINGCPDRDGDKIADHKDACPELFGLARLNGCPIPDSDNDGFNDEVDRCPKEYGKNNGCPEKKQELVEANKATEKENGQTRSDEPQDTELISSKSAAEPHQIKIKNPSPFKRFFIGLAYEIYQEKGKLSDDGSMRIYDPNSILLKTGYRINKGFSALVQAGWNLNLGNHINFGIGTIAHLGSSIDLGITYINKKTFSYVPRDEDGYSARAGGLQLDLGYYISDIKIFGLVNYHFNSAIGTVETDHTGFGLGLGYRI